MTDIGVHAICLQLTIGNRRRPNGELFPPEIPQALPGDDGATNQEARAEEKGDKAVQAARGANEQENESELQGAVQFSAVEPIARKKVVHEAYGSFLGAGEKFFGINFLHLSLKLLDFCLGGLNKVREDICIKGGSFERSRGCFVDLGSFFGFWSFGGYRLFFCLSICLDATATDMTGAERAG